MEHDRLRRIATEYLCPLFSGAWLADAVSSSVHEQRVARRDSRSLAFKVESTDAYRLILRRRERFGMTAERVVESFVDVLRDIEPALSTAYEQDVLRTLQMKVLARAVAGGDMHDAIVCGLDWLETWAVRPYEGQPVRAALGFDPCATGAGMTLKEFCALEFSAVLSNGVDTMVLVDPKGRLVGHECLSSPDVAPSYTPYAQSAFAAWAVGDRAALILTGMGEILIFKDSQLLFAKRSGRWHFLTHRPIITRMPVPNSVAIRRAVYESCLDAAFARRGACIGVVMKDSGERWREVIMPQDYLGNRESPGTRGLALMIAGRPFAELDRRLRLELMSIDGALVMDHRGRILTAGAILKIPGGSTGGGRLAAARVLSSFGLGIKVSQDGSIVCFHRDEPEPVFSLM